MHKSSFSSGEGFNESQLVLDRKIDVIQYKGQRYFVIRELGNEKKYTQESSDGSSGIKPIKDTLNLISTFLDHEDLSTGDFLKFDEVKNEYVLTMDSYDINQNTANENIELEIESGEVIVYLDINYRITKVEIRYISKLETNVSENITVYDTLDNSIITKFVYEKEQVDFEEWINKFNLIN